MSGSVSLAPTNVRHDADRLHPLRCTEWIEILHILLEHFYDSQRNENAGSARRLHRRQPVPRSQDLLSPLRQFQRRVAVLGSVAHLVAKDPGGLLAMSPGGDRSKIHTRDGSKPYPRCLTGGSSHTTVQLWD